MARSQRLQKKPGCRRPSLHKGNPAGYLKRHARKSLPSKNVSDVYEFEPENNRRSKITLDVGADEARNLAQDVSDEGEDEDGRLKPRLVGERGDDDRIDSEDDEDIDSDAAFDESDDEKYAGHQLSHKAHKKPAKKKAEKTTGVRFAEVNLDEDEEVRDEIADPEDDEEIDEGDADEFIDVLDILDGRGEADDGGDVQGTPAKETTHPEESDENFNQDDEDSEENEDSEADDGESEPSMSSVSDAEDAPGDLENLEKFITNLDPTTKRKSTGDPELDERAEIRPKKRRLVEERTEAGAENEFHAQLNGTKLDLNDLLAPLPSQSVNVMSLKASAKVLASSSKTKTLAAPLPQRTQEKLDREAAYEKTKEEVDKWSTTMKHIKEAEHLSFPLQSQRAARPSTSELTAKFKPMTELEISIDNLLKSAKLRDEDIQQTEELAMNHLSVEEVTARRDELRTMRELLFRAEVKAKRVAKIKSKTYRRLKKKERAKLAAKIDGEVEEEDESVRMKMEMNRARERATLRHKHTGKWAKEMKAKGGVDVDERRQISEMLERGELLRKKIRGENRSGEDDGDDSDGDDDAGDDEATIKARAFEELAGLDDNSNSQPGLNGMGRSVFDMKFMKDAMARDQERANKMVDDFVKEMGDEGSESEEIRDGGDTRPNSVVVNRVGGRMSYRPGAPLLPTRSLASDSSSVTLKSTDLSPRSPPPPAPQSISVLASVPETNPWLMREVVTKAPRKKNEVVVAKNSAAAEKSKHKLKKQVNKLDEEKGKTRDDAQLEISLTDVLTLGDATDSVPPPETANSQSEVGKTDDKSQKQADAAEDSDANSEVEEQEKALIVKAHGKRKKKGLQAFEQRDLVALAFAGDNVVRDFQEAKNREIAEDAPREVDTTLPGWGTWGGLGTRRQPSKPHLIKKIAGIDPKSRADHQKTHVIISEKRDKKAAKYLVKDLPFPYTSKAQFERSIERPLGTEWNTRLGFQRGTLPRVVKKMGTIIDPLEKLF